MGRRFRGITDAGGDVGGSSSVIAGAEAVLVGGAAMVGSAAMVGTAAGGSVAGGRSVGGTVVGGSSVAAEPQPASARIKTKTTSHRFINGDITGSLPF